jgi:predicted ATP-dependent endonuclease of OLD family
MKLKTVAIHNFRGILDGTFEVRDYTLLVGPNNAGKSSVIDAVRCCYEKDGYKFKQDRDFPYSGSSDRESWIDLEFSLNKDEYESLKDEYRRSEQSLKVRKYFQTEEKDHEGKSANGCIFAFTKEGGLSKNHFYGAKAVQNGKIGDLVYIPAVSKVDDHAKLTGPSALRDLVSDVLQSVVESSKAFTDFTAEFGDFAKQIKEEKTDDGRSLAGLENELNALMATWPARFCLHLNSPSPTEIIKSLATFDFAESNSGRTQTADQFGSGFQRHFIYSLIQIGSMYIGKKASTKAKDFTPSMTLILFEEPEAFLHPPQQELLCRSLKEITRSDDHQVLCSTHSSHFVSKNALDIPAIVRVRRENGITGLFQVKDGDWKVIVETNQSINEIASRWPKMKKDLDEGDLRHEMESVKYFLWLNPDRCGLFFANHVLLVEGAAEQAIINKLIGQKKIDDKNCGLYVLDCLGKYNIHRFMNLLSVLGVPHSVIHDDDENKDHHKEINELIQNSAHPTFTKKIAPITDELESYLGISKTSPHRKPQHIVLLYASNQIDQQKISKFIGLVESTL